MERVPRSKFTANTPYSIPMKPGLKPIVSPGHFSGKLKPRHIYGTAGSSEIKSRHLSPPYVTAIPGSVRAGVLNDWCISILLIAIVFLSCPLRKHAFSNMQKISPPKTENITKTCLCNFDPLKPNFYIIKLGFTGVCIIFFGYSLEPPRRGGSNEYPQSMFLSRNMKNMRFFYLKIF